MNTQDTITVYHHREGYHRVVRGEHMPHANAKHAKVSVYPNASLAYASETDSRIRANIAIFDPSLNDTQPTAEFVPAGEHMVEHIERWYNRNARSWVVQRFDSARNQVGDADYVGTRGEAIRLVNYYLSVHTGAKEIV